MRIFYPTLIALVYVTVGLSAKELSLLGPNQETWVVNVSEGTSSEDLKKLIQSNTGISEEELDLLADGEPVEKNTAASSLLGKFLKVCVKGELAEGTRDYWQVLSMDEMRIIREQVVAIANSSLPRLLWIQSHLESMEKEINHVHPLRYLLFVFEEEETKVAMRNVKRRGGFVWSKLNDRISHSLRKDNDLGNLTKDQVDDMADRLGIRPDSLYDPVERCDSSALISELIALVPRRGDFNRYNM